MKCWEHAVIEAQGHMRLFLYWIVAMQVILLLEDIFEDSG